MLNNQPIFLPYPNPARHLGQYLKLVPRVFILLQPYL